MIKDGETIVYDKEKIKAVCRSCNGTGIYVGFAESDGVGVVCLNCKGSGYIIIYYEPFVERKIRDNINRVRRNSYCSCLTGVGPVGNYISYSDFINGKMPTV
ncbi:MAG: hypothetical protein AABY32_01735 [Nanoarchaeota archaeon]